MDIELVKQINDLTLDVLRNKNTSDSQIIQRKLIRLENQINLLRFKLKIIEDPELRLADEEFSDYNFITSHHNALTKYHLAIPLLLYLLQNHKKKESAYLTSIGFMNESINFLKEGDFANLMTGSQRFITNTRFAADILRRYGLLRSDKKSFYKIWELSLFGLILASNVYKNLSKNISPEILDSNDRHSVEWKTFKILEKYSITSNSLEKFWKIVEYVKEEKEVLHFDNSIKEYFDKYILLFDEVMNKGSLSRKNNSTKDFLNLISSINSDNSISLLVDSLILREEIKLNMQQVHKILSDAKL